MKLSTLLRDVPGARVIGDPEIEIKEVRDDSRDVEPGDAFVAIRGFDIDGHKYVDNALSAGARVLVLERELAEPPAGVTQVIVERTIHALGPIAAEQFCHPGDRMALIGITGTNGKTTTTYLIEAILQAAGQSPGIIGTVNNRYAGRIELSPFTTPTPLLLHGAFARFLAAGCTHAAMEVSSIGLAMGRTAGVKFNVAGFSNLSQDHLDMHETMEAYRQAKELLFSEHLADDGTAVINIDDPASSYMIAAAGGRRVLRVSCDPERDADILVTHFESTIGGISAEVRTPRGVVSLVSRSLIGHYNVANLAMAVGIAEALGIDLQAMSDGIAGLAGVPGRVERVANERGLDILVDYAHTPDALENVLAALKPLAQGRLICVFGCGGDRDPTKRPIMGAAATRHADLPVVTSDNPRTEEPQSIVDMILPAVPDPFFVDTDRAVAIRAAVAEATPGDIVLIAGKGHEDYQILGTTKIHFDDREQAAEAVSERWYFALADVARVCGGEIVHRPAGASADGDDAVEFARVHYNGRIAAPGDLYVAVRGTRVDGHDYCAQAVAAGATGVIIETGTSVPTDADGAPIDAYVIAVPAGQDNGGAPLDGGRMALGKLGAYHRERWQTADGPDAPRRPVIAITGSAGKTTTKELLVAALHTAGPVHATGGSFNNETGVPYTLLGLKRHHRVAVVEMGMRAIGQIDYLVEMAAPEVGVVVNAGIAHVGVVGSVEDIARGKSEIFGRLPASGHAVLPADDPRLTEHARGAPARVTFGAAEGADVRLVEYRPAGVDGADIALAVGDATHRARVRMPGRHNADNAACAVAAAVAVGVPAERAVADLARARAVSMRGETVEVADRHVLVDCYNANPASMAAAFHTVGELTGDRSTLVVVGDMLELGDSASAAHREVGALATRLGFAVVALGEHKGDVVAGAGGSSGARARAVADVREAAQRALAGTTAGDWILIKASRGMRLERVLDEMRALAEEA